MKSFLATLAVAASLALAPAAASAQERVGDAALGGLSGALVFGPVGAVAGIIVGYTAGPAIGRSWGFYPDCRYYCYYPDRVAQRPSARRSAIAAARQVKSASAAPARPAADMKPAWNAPPVAGFE